MSQVAHVFGNLKPKALQETEASAWQMMYRVLSGFPVQDEVIKFLNRFSTMREDWKLRGIQDLQLDFFDNKGTCDNLMNYCTVANLPEGH